MAVDLLRTGYTRGVRFFKDRPDIVIRVRWYRCKPGAKWFPGYTRFASGDWAYEKVHWPGPGEVLESERKWDNGWTPPTADGQHFCGTLEQFAEGCLFDPLQETEYDGFGIPVCCPSELPHPAGGNLGFDPLAARGENLGLDGRVPALGELGLDGRVPALGELGLDGRVPALGELGLDERVPIPSPHASGELGLDGTVPALGELGLDRYALSVPIGLLGLGGTATAGGELGLNPQAPPLPTGELGLDGTVPADGELGMHTDAGPP